MRSIAVAMLLIGSACVRDEPQRAPQSRTPVATAARAVPPAAPRAEPAAPVAVAAPVDPRVATRRAAHEALVEHCGACHEGHRPTAVAKALAVFDLDQPDWPARFDDHRFQSAAARLKGKSVAARDAFLAFRDAELAASRAPLN